jgi:SAM-dependent methyltransferase
MYIFQPDRYLLQKQIKSVSHYIEGKVLDVGAGEFDRYGKFFRPKERVRMDIAPGQNVDVVGSADKIPFAEGTFDSVICTQVFEHLKYPQKSAAEIFRVLKNGGHAVVTVPQMNELHEEPHDYFRYTKYGLRVLFSDAGFKIIEEHQRGGYYATLSQMRIRHFIGILNLYERPFWGKVLGKVIFLYGRMMIYLDHLHLFHDDRTQTIGWCFVLKK